MISRKKKAPRAAAVIFMDVVYFAVVLVVFALFHHVIPRAGRAPQNIANFVTPTATVRPVSEQEAARPAQTEEVLPSAEPVGEPAPGDFSSSFPSGDTGENALYSYQGDAFKVAIHRVQENGITYYAADVWVKNIQAFRTAFAKNQYGTGIHQEPVKMAAAGGAVFAVTGDYYGARGKGVVIRNGNLYRDSLHGDVCVLYVDGTMETLHQADFDMERVIDGNAWQAWSFGPQLLENGQPITEFPDAIKGKNPRSAIGYYEPGHYCFVTVDGRQPGYSDGMTLAELSEVFASLGCKAAYNLDGGATAEMIFQGQVVNKPYKGGRESSDIICF